MLTDCYYGHIGNANFSFACMCHSTLYTNESLPNGAVDLLEWQYMSCLKQQVHFQHVSGDLFLFHSLIITVYKPITGMVLPL